MSDLETRIYRDASRTAAEVTAADIRPLDLSEAGNSRAGRARHGRARHGRSGSPAARWSGGRPGIGAWRVVAPVAASVSVAGLAAALIVIGQGPAHHGGHTAPKSPETKPSSSPRRNLGREALDSYFPASGATYTAGLAFSWTQAKVTAADIDPCLAAAGFPQPAFSGSVRLYKLSFGDLSQFPDLAQMAANPGEHTFIKQYLVLHHPTRARQRAIDRAQARCTAKHARAVTRVDKAAEPLGATWFGIISRIEHSHPVTATQPAFARCLQAHGVPASLATETDPTANNPLFYGYFAWSDGLTQTATTSSQIAKDQRRASRVFLACAPPVVKVLEPLQLHRRAQFFRDHAAQIARIVRLASKMMAAPRH
jgi:hypothetical protein